MQARFTFRVNEYIHSQNTGGGHRPEASLPDRSEGMAAHEDSGLGVDVQVSIIADSALRYESEAHEPPRTGIVAPYSLLIVHNG